jgi:hypothetical protein
MPDGTTEVARAVGVDGASGALLVEDEEGDERELLFGEVTQVRLARENGDPGRRGVTH